MSEVEGREKDERNRRVFKTYRECKRILWEEDQRVSPSCESSIRTVFEPCRACETLLWCGRAASTG